MVVTRALHSSGPGSIPGVHQTYEVRQCSSRYHAGLTLWRPGFNSPCGQTFKANPIKSVLTPH